MQIVFIRHFKSLGNEDPKQYQLHGNAGVPLSETGIAQAPEAAQALDGIMREYGITSPDEMMILCSPYTRAQQTLAGLHEHTQNEALENYDMRNVQIEEWLREIDVGKAKDLTPAESETLYRAHHQAAKALLKPDVQTQKNQSEQWKFPYGETPLSRFEAIEQADIRRQFQAHQAKGVKLVICVSHQMNIGAAEAVLYDKDPSRIIPDKRLSNGGMLAINMHEDGHFDPAELKYGAYTETDIECVATRPLREASDISALKTIRHQNLQQSYPEGLLDVEPEPRECGDAMEMENPVNSFIQREIERKEQGLQQSKPEKPLPSRR